MIPRALTLLAAFVILLGVFSGEAEAAQKTDKRADANWIRHISEDIRFRGDEEPVALSPVQKYAAYGTKGPIVECEDINPEMGLEFVLEHTNIGHTWYDFQKNGSMGRMMSVTPGGYRHFSWTFTDGPYGVPNYRYVDANCRTPAGGYIGEVHVYGGAAKNAGYSNQTHMSDGRSVVMYHRTAGQVGDPTTYSMISIEDALCSGMFNTHWDLPDSIRNAPSGENGMWPKCEVKYDDVAGKDYIHVVMTEGNMASGVPVMIAYQRCCLDDDPNYLVCRAYVGGATNTYTLTKNVNYSDPANLVEHFDSSCSITPVVVVSPVSKRVAIPFIKPTCDGSCDYMGDIAWVESMNNGGDWIWGNNIYNETNLTNYGCGYPEEMRAYEDLNACYDYNDSLHIVWSTVGFPEPGYVQPGIARLWHWSKTAGTGMITSAIWGGTDPGGHNANIAKMSISAKDPIYHPGGDPDSMFLFCIWTQFDTTTPLDQSDAEYTNGELYGTGSNDGGITWGNIWNLTQTRTPGCTPGDCVSEHWSSLAHNMHNGDLHIQYVCDKHPGTALPDQDPGSIWVDNPMFYLNLGQWDVGARCEGTYECLRESRMKGHDNLHKPPIKVPPDGIRNIRLRITNVGNLPMLYTVIATDPDGCISGSYSDVLPITQSVIVTFTIIGSGECNGEFIQGYIELTMCDEITIIPVHVVVADDYYECPIDPQTERTVETDALTMYVCANSLEWIDDISSWPNEVHQVFFQGGPFVATSMNNNKAVGRYYGDNDFRAGVRDKLYYDLCQFANHNCHLLRTKDIYIIPPPIPPFLFHCYWWWWEWSKTIKICELPDNKKIVIKYVRVQRHDPPAWWPQADPPQGPYTGHDDTYIGMMMDVDCPADPCPNEESVNFAGYDHVDHIAWQQGYHDPANPQGHPEYANYYAGMALANPANVDPVAPFAAHNVLNAKYLYPQTPWGWKDDELYDLAAMPGVFIWVDPLDPPDTPRDRSIVMSATHIPAGNQPHADHSFVVIEAMTKDGLASLQSLIAEGRAMVVEETTHGIPIKCGDASCDHQVGLGDVIWILNYLFKGGDPPCCPILRGDANGDGIVGIGDAVYLLNYLFKLGPAPDCPGIFF